MSHQIVDVPCRWRATPGEILGWNDDVEALPWADQVVFALLSFGCVQEGADAGPDGFLSFVPGEHHFCRRKAGRSNRREDGLCVSRVSCSKFRLNSGFLNMILHREYVHISALIADKDMPAIVFVAGDRSGRQAESSYFKYLIYIILYEN